MSISIAFAKKTTKLHKNSSLGDCTTPRSVSRYATIFVFEIKSSRISLSRELQVERNMDRSRRANRDSFIFYLS